MMENIGDIPPKKPHSQDCVTLGIPHFALHPPDPSGNTSDPEGDPRIHPAAPHFCSARPGPRCGGVPVLGAAFERGGASTCSSVAPAGAGKGHFVQLGSRSCIPASGEAGGVSRCRRNLLFAPVLQEESLQCAGCSPGGWGGRESLLPLERDSVLLLCRQDMTRLPKSGRSPSSDSRRRARTREISSGSSASHFPGSRQLLAAGQSSAWGAQWAYLFVYLFILLFFFFFFSQLGKPSPPTLAHPSMHRRGAGGSPWGFASSFSRLYGTPAVTQLIIMIETRAGLQRWSTEPPNPLTCPGESLVLPWDPITHQAHPSALLGLWGEFSPQLEAGWVCHCPHATPHTHWCCPHPGQLPIATQQIIILITHLPGYK
ncbi:uncharacterized protein LOC132338397 isoform X2 [Haemorhous mexicanus]|uniref:uncharacterized protein LOC132338397 isoform X2 n=1 Tax=Haemorhous mexicanus TaxID=30427 RepID=UPI0028BDE097|nr:uncharacterized protein LOC132338397 isoform X2 [Haemorhous mexicanus]